MEDGGGGIAGRLPDAGDEIEAVVARITQGPAMES